MEDQILRGMIIENLTQRDNEHSEETSNVLAIKKYLLESKLLLGKDGKFIHPTVGQMKSSREDGRGGKTDEVGSISQISLKKYLLESKLLLGKDGSFIQPSDKTKISKRGREDEGRPDEYGSISQISLKKYLLESKLLLGKDGKVVIHPSDSQKNPRPQNNPKVGSISQISLWLDKGSGEVMSIGKISEFLKVYSS